MVARFYKRYSVCLLLGVGLLFPYFYHLAETLPANNNIETWLPKESAVRATYDEFKRYFGAEEIVLVGLTDLCEDDPLVEAICVRLESLSCVRSCWSPKRMKTVMRDFGVPANEIQSRLKGLTISENGSLIGLVAVLSSAGLKDRIATVEEIREQLEYCQLRGDSMRLAGAPVVVAELDRLGNRSSNRSYFLVTLAICLGLLYYTVREWRLALSILGVTVWGLEFSVAAIHLAGGKMNFVLDALPVLVMVFTLAVAIHFLHYYAASARAKDPLAAALKQAWWPCFLSILTTAIGLASLAVSDIAPVSQFGCAAAFGAVIALISGLGLTPAILTVLSVSPGDVHVHRGTKIFSRVGNWIIDHSARAAVVSITLVVVTGLGLLRLHSKIDPLDFLPEDARVLADIREIQRDLTSTESIEAMVDFGDRELSFVQKLDEVRMLEDVVRQHPGIAHTMSLASFFPRELPEEPLELAQLLEKVARHRGENEYVSEDERVWRVSMRTNPECGLSQQECFDELAAMTKDLPVTLTGIAPLLDLAQKEIFRTFWNSFAMAFAIITVLMVIALVSLRMGLLGMLPNIAPIALVFGFLGWIQFPVDIGMMMTGSIALGLAVDGTFHFLLHFQEQNRLSRDPVAAARASLLQTGPPIVQATLVTGSGMLALTLSSFGPTVRFGFLMATITVAAMVGDLILLPALVSLSGKRERSVERGPHFVAADRIQERGRQPALSSVE